jgi:hypothetical protein
VLPAARCPLSVPAAEQGIHGVYVHRERTEKSKPTFLLILSQCLVPCITGHDLICTQVDTYLATHMCGMHAALRRPPSLAPPPPRGHEGGHNLRGPPGAE